MTSPAHIRLASVEPKPLEDMWQLDLPKDPVAAAEYLKGMERARELELAAIRRLRARIEGDAPRRRLGRRQAGILAVLIVAAIGLGSWTFLGTDPMPAAHDASAHAGHAAMGSGVAVMLHPDGPTASRTKLTAGETTLVVRNHLGAATTVELVREGAPANSKPIESETVGAGDRTEWTVELAPGRWQLCALVDGRPVMGDTLVVA